MGGGRDFDFVNGYALPVVRMPPAHCDVCADGILSKNSGIPFTLPVHLRSGWPTNPVPLSEYAKLVQTIRADETCEGLKDPLLPGSYFATFDWSIPTQPIFEVYWQDAATIVSRRVAYALESRGYRGLCVRPVRVVHAGTTDPRIRPIPDLPYDDFDGMLRALPSMNQHARERLMFYSVTVPTVFGEVAWEAGTESCPNCRTPLTEEAGDVILERLSRYFERHQANGTIPRHETADTDVFRNVLYPGIIVTDEMHRTLIGLGLENASYRKVQVVDEAPEMAIKDPR